MERNRGKLYLVATPLGNLEDITQRALRILNEVDLIMAEDTRHTLKLLNYFNIKKKLISFHQHNEREKSIDIINRIKSGFNIAVVSDAGMPGISDPGGFLVRQAVEEGVTIIPIPGPSAVITALAASGLDTTSFFFLGFLPRKKTEQLNQLEKFVNLDTTLIFYEAPHRLIATLKNVAIVLGDREMVLARELTKIHEEFLRGKISFIIDYLSKEEIKGEFTVLVEGSKQNDKKLQNSTINDISDHFSGMNLGNYSLKKEIKEIAKKTGKSPNEVYRLYLEYKKKSEA